MILGKVLKLPAMEFIFALLVHICVFFYLIQQSDIWEICFGGNQGGATEEVIHSSANFWLLGIIHPFKILYFLQNISGPLLFWLYARKCYSMLSEKSENVFSFVIPMLILIMYPLITSFFSMYYMCGISLLLLINVVFFYLREIVFDNIKFRSMALFCSITAILINPYLWPIVSGLTLSYLIHVMLYSGYVRNIRNTRIFLAIQFLMLIPLDIYSVRIILVENATSLIGVSELYGNISIWEVIFYMIVLVAILAAFFIKRSSLMGFMFNSVFASLIIVAILFLFNFHSETIMLVMTGVIVCSGFLMLELINQLGRGNDKVLSKQI